MKINIEKRHLYMLAILVILISGASVFAAWDSSKPSHQTLYTDSIEPKTTNALSINGEVRSTVNGVEFYMVPKGAIIMWSGSIANIPSGWALCNGNSGTPNLRDRFIVGAGNQYAVGSTGGEQKHTLQIAEMPSHNHAIYSAGTSTGYASGVFDDPVLRIGQNIASGARGNKATTSSGSSVAHENRPPYYALAYIMKI